jgi:folate-binding protein YgfZ
MTITPQIPALPSTLPAHGISPLPEWGLILVEGPDAATLLQSQLSNSVVGLRPTIPGEIAEGHEAVRLVGYCSPKGRLLASAWLALYPQATNSNERFALFISRDIAASTAKKLSMFILRSKVKVTDVSDEWEILGAYQDMTVLEPYSLKNESLGLRLPNVIEQEKVFKRFLIAQTKNESKQIEQDDACLEQWNALEVLSGIPRIVLATQEQFVPQMINFESVAGVDFKKGCYPGQEIVARSQYRGAVKRRLQLAHTQLTDSALELSKPGVELYHSSDSTQPCGMVVLASRNPAFIGRINLQVECKLDALEVGDIQLGNRDGPVLKIDLLPYPLLEI